MYSMNVLGITFIEFIYTLIIKIIVGELPFVIYKMKVIPLKTGYIWI